MISDSDRQLGELDATHDDALWKSDDLSKLRLPPLTKVPADPIVGGNRVDPWERRAHETAMLAARVVVGNVTSCEVFVSSLEPEESFESFDPEFERLVDLYELLVEELREADVSVELVLVEQTDDQYVEFVSRLAARLGVQVDNWLVPPFERSEELLRLIAAHSPGADRGVDLA